MQLLLLKACESFLFRERVKNRGGSRTAATYKMECFVIIINGFQPLTIITKHSILDVAASPISVCEPVPYFGLFDSFLVFRKQKKKTK